MSPASVPHNALPGSSRLFTDFLSGVNHAARFYDYAPADASRFGRAASAIEYPAERRTALVRALGEQNGESPALDLLARPGTAVVSTGQQVGLFSGPAYTIYKALTAAALARRLSGQGIPAVAVFWLATQDHDLAEVSSCWVFDHERRPARIELTAEAGPGAAVGTVRIATSPVDGLRAGLGGLPFAGEVCELAAAAYRRGQTLGGAFTSLLKSLTGSGGLLYLDPLDPAMRALAAPLLRRAVEAGPDLAAALDRRNGELAGAGYHAQVHVEEGTSLFFLLDGDRRVTLRREGMEYTAPGRRYRAGDLAERAERLSPSALLRPVVADYMMPTVATVLGPAELAYMAQSQVLYRLLGGRVPVIVPRAGFTILDARAAKLMGRYGFRLGDLFHGEEALGESIAAKLIPAPLAAALQASQEEVAGILERLRGGMAGFDATLVRSLEKGRAKILYQFSKLDRKAARESARRDERASRDAAWLANLVYPHKHLQERFYTILAFLALDGLDFMERLNENVHMDCPGHQVLVV